MIATVVLFAWIAVRQELPTRLPAAVGVAARGVWLAIAVVGLVALVQDIQALT